MKKTIFIIGLAVFGGTMISSTSVYAQGKEQKETTVKRVSKEEFKKYLSEHKNIQLVDVRTPGEYSQGTINGATNIDFYNPEFKAEIAKLDKDTPTLIFCRSGGRSAKALQQFKAEGFNVVLELEGGYLNW